MDVYPLMLSGWDDIEPTVSLTLQLGWIISKVDIWRKFHQLRIISIVDNESKIRAEETRLKKLLRAARIEAIVKVVHLVDSDFSSTKNVVTENSNTKLEESTTTEPEGLFSNLNSYYKKLSVKQKYSILNNVFKRNSSKTSK